MFNMNTRNSGKIGLIVSCIVFFGILIYGFQYLFTFFSPGALVGFIEPLNKYTFYINGEKV